MESLSPTSYWIILGLILIIAEIFTLSFFIFFFGVGALVVAGLRWLGLLDNLPVEIGLFGAIGFLSLLVFRKAIRKNLHKARGIEIDNATVVSLTHDVPARSLGKIEYQGTLWDAFNDSDKPLFKGDSAVIVRTESIRLILQPAD